MDSSTAESHNSTCTNTDRNLGQRQINNAEVQGFLSLVVFCDKDTTSFKDFKNEDPSMKVESILGSC